MGAWGFFQKKGKYLQRSMQAKKCCFSTKLEIRSEAIPLLSNTVLLVELRYTNLNGSFQFFDVFVEVISLKGTSLFNR